MTSYAFNDGVNWIECEGTFEFNEIQYNAEWVRGADDEQRASLGFVPVVEVPQPEGVIVTGRGLEDFDGQPRRKWFVKEFTLDELKAAKKAQAERMIAVKMSGGFPCTLGGNEERLQLRNETDRTNWLTFHSVCRDAMLAGAGDSVSLQPIRTQDNRNYSVTYAEGAALMADLRTWAGAIMAVAWGLKDAIAAAETKAAVEAVDIEGAPWP